MKRILIIMMFPLASYSQFSDLPQGTNTIVIEGVSFKNICNYLLDENYTLKDKDNDLYTVETEPRQFPKGSGWNAVLKLFIRVKNDSICYITGNFTTAGGYWVNVQAENIISERKKPSFAEKLYISAFTVFDNECTKMAKTLNKDMHYEKR